MFLICLTSILRGLSNSAFGKVMLKTPSSNSAPALAASTPSGIENAWLYEIELSTFLDFDFRSADSRTILSPTSIGTYFRSTPGTSTRATYASSCSNQLGRAERLPESEIQSPPTSKRLGKLPNNFSSSFSKFENELPKKGVIPYLELNGLKFLIVSSYKLNSQIAVTFGVHKWYQFL